MIEYQGETYVSVGEIAKRFNISRGTCYANVLQQIEKYYLPGRKHALYKQSDVEQFAEVRIVTNSHCRAFPASPTTAEARNGDTSSSRTFFQSSVDWQGQYSLPVLEMQDV